MVDFVTLVGRLSHAGLHWSLKLPVVHCGLALEQSIGSLHVLSGLQPWLYDGPSHPLKEHEGSPGGAMVERVGEVCEQRVRGVEVGVVDDRVDRAEEHDGRDHCERS